MLYFSELVLLSTLEAITHAYILPNHLVTIIHVYHSTLVNTQGVKALHNVFKLRNKTILSSINALNYGSNVVFQLTVLSTPGLITCNNIFPDYLLKKYPKLYHFAFWPFSFI